MVKLREWIENIKRHNRYLRHELECKRNGDTRDDFEKLVDKCRILEINKDIHNYSGECF